MNLFYYNPFEALSARIISDKQFKARSAGVFVIDTPSLTRPEVRSVFIETSALEHFIVVAEDEAFTNESRSITSGGFLGLGLVDAVAETVETMALDSQYRDYNFTGSWYDYTPIGLALSLSVPVIVSGYEEMANAYYHNAVFGFPLRKEQEEFLRLYGQRELRSRIMERIIRLSTKIPSE